MEAAILKSSFSHIQGGRGSGGDNLDLNCTFGSEIRHTPSLPRSDGISTWKPIGLFSPMVHLAEGHFITKGVEPGQMGKLPSYVHIYIHMHIHISIYAHSSYTLYIYVCVSPSMHPYQSLCIIDAYTSPTHTYSYTLARSYIKQVFKIVMWKLQPRSVILHRLLAEIEEDNLITYKLEFMKKREQAKSKHVHFHDYVNMVFYIKK